MKAEKRQACRAILLTPDHEVLLIHLNNQDANWLGWITPGGGMDPGESPQQTLTRELWEELGLKNFNSEGPVWTRSHEFVWRGRQFAQDEIFYLVRTRRFDPKPQVTTEEMFDFKGMRWWTLAEIGASKQIFAPRDLHKLLMELIEGGIPAQPIAIGV